MKNRVNSLLDQFQRAQYIDTEREKHSKSVDLKAKGFLKIHKKSIRDLADKNK
jgi:hypothetical protein